MDTSLQQCLQQLRKQFIHNQDNVIWILEVQPVHPLCVDVQRNRQGSHRVGFDASFKHHDAEGVEQA